MSAKENPCRKFQANIFNKSKCQNCFKPRESHLLNDEDLNQVKSLIFWGCLILGETGQRDYNGLYAPKCIVFLLFSASHLCFPLSPAHHPPAGTINMNQCTDVVDGESRTGQKFSLCILTPEKEHFIRAENKEIISGWLEMLVVYPRTNKQNQKKKRKVEPPTPQEPGPAKMAVTSSNIPGAEKVPTTKSTLWQEEMRGKDQPDGNGGLSPVPSPIQGQGPPSCLLDGKEDESAMNGDRNDCGRKTRVESGYFSLEKTKQEVKLEEQPLLTPPSPPSPSTPGNRRSQVIEKFEALDIENAEHMETNTSTSETRQGRSEKRVFPRKRDFVAETATSSILDMTASPLSPHRRAKSLDRRSTESSMTPDLLNFKKGWLTKQYEDGQVNWGPWWFSVLKRSDPAVNSSSCQPSKGKFTLSAMTSGIRRNWIQTIMKHVRPTTAPDVTSSLPEERSKTSSSLDSCPKPSEKQDAEQAELDPEHKRSRARERRREGRSKTFDWAEFRPIQQALAQERANVAENSKDGGTTFPKEPGEADSGELERERARRREERRKRFESLDAPDAGSPEDFSRMEVDRLPGLPTPSETKSHVHVEIEQRWHQVETTPLREEKQVPIAPLHLSHAEDGNESLNKQHLTTLLEKELEQSQKTASDLLEQNRVLQDQLKVALGREQSAREGYVLQATCERGFAAMEETHQKKIEDLQRQHQRELEKLREEKDRLLAEETAATISAIEAMKNAHREELERELEKTQRSQISSINSDIEALQRQYLEELQSVQRELEVLSEQYSQKCLENAHLAQALEAERQALRQCQRENQELNAHNQELNNRLAAEITRLRTLLTGEGGMETAGSPLTQGKDAYELEVLLRVKESEIQYLKQEISSLKDELQTALRDKKYASDKYKDIYTELSIVKAKADCDISRLKEQLKAATEALGEKSPENSTVSGYDIMKSKSNPDFLKKDRTSVGRQLRNIRSKVSFHVTWSLGARSKTRLLELVTMNGSIYGSPIFLPQPALN
uniref:Myosin phosphatase Rho interacting protein n=1 Tax=Anolis carolinensis TaxID=28377 RepID=A0A803SX55_ANOCA